MNQVVRASIVFCLPVLLVLAGCPRPVAPPATPSNPVGPKAVGPTAGPTAPTAGKSLAVFAGSASKPALTELASQYQARTGTKIDVTTGGSGAVMAQFVREQFGDVYIPGSDDFMEKAEKKEAVRKDTRTVLVYLVPAICVPKGNPQAVHGLQDLTRQDLRVVIGEPKSVCLGEIAQSVLTATGLWEKAKPRIATYATSCEETLNHLLLGEADVIIGWDVFARQHPDKVEAIALPKELARVRNIPAAVITWSRHPDAARAFIEFLASESARTVYRRHGYTVDKPGGA